MTNHVSNEDQSCLKLCNGCPHPEECQKSEECYRALLHTDYSYIDVVDINKPVKTAKKTEGEVFG